ncbi:hypothetical protein PIB30_099390, partial [Stylosanthes scabra]|nr:hypothetical protein [Stylosanthes scabra]
SAFSVLEISSCSSFFLIELQLLRGIHSLKRFRSMVLFQPSQLKLKNGLIPLATKLDEHNFSTWQKSVLLTVRTLKLESHFDSSRTPPQFEEIISSKEKDAKSAISTSTEGETPPPKKKTSPDPIKILQESEKYVEWAQHDLALMT